MKKLVFLIPLLLLIQPAFGEMIVENDQTYIGNDGIMHIVGEIKNGDESELIRSQELTQLSFEAEQAGLKSFNDAKAGIQQ